MQAKWLLEMEKPFVGVCARVMLLGRGDHPPSKDLGNTMTHQKDKLLNVGG